MAGVILVERLLAAGRFTLVLVLGGRGDLGEGGGADVERILSVNLRPWGVRESNTG